MGNVANEDLGSIGPGAGILGMAFQAKVGVALDQQAAIDRTMRIVADHTAVTHRFVLEDKGPALGAMAGRTGFVLSGHGQTTGSSKNIPAVRVMALDAIHFAFSDWMMMWKLKIGVGGKMALVAGGGIPPRIDNKPSFASTRCHMLAPRPVA